MTKRVATKVDTTVERTANHRCGRCGEVVDPRNGLEQPVAHGQSTWRVKCPVCRYDGVRCWGDLFAASASEGNDLRRELFPFGDKHGSAIVLRDAGFVAYNASSYAWEMTPAGDALIRRWRERGAP